MIKVHKGHKDLNYNLSYFLLSTDKISHSCTTMYKGRFNIIILTIAYQHHSACQSRFHHIKL